MVTLYVYIFITSKLDLPAPLPERSSRQTGFETQVYHKSKTMVLVSQLQWLQNKTISGGNIQVFPKIDQSVRMCQNCIC